MSALAEPSLAPAPPSPLLRRRPRLGRRTQAALALAAYLCLSALLYGRGVLAHPTTALVGYGPARHPGHDQGAFVWYFDWIARSIVHLRDPLSSMAIYQPHGWNLAWATALPGPAALLTPLTLTGGPVLVYNLLTLLAPALTAWTAYLLCREISPPGTGLGEGAFARAAPALAGGLLFGFGTYETVETINHVYLSLVALVPLAPLLVLRRHRGRISRTRFVIALGVLLAAQMLISTEVLATMVMFAAIALALWAVLADRAEAGEIARTAGEAAAGLALAALLSGPFLYQAFRFGDPVQGITEHNSGLDIANLLTATRATLLPGIGNLFWSARRLHSDLTEQAGYFGVPMLAMLAAFAWSFRRTLAGRWLLWFMLTVLGLALGGVLIVQGRKTGIELPWQAFAKLPQLRFAVPGRYTLYLWLAAAAAASLWLARGRIAHGGARWALFGLVALSLAPTITGMPWSTPLDRPSLMSGPALARYVPRGGTVLALPYGSKGNSMLWQEQAGFRFRMAGGYASFEPPPQYARWRWRLLPALGGKRVRGDLTPALCSFLRYTKTATILLRDGSPGQWHRLLGPLDVEPSSAGGFMIYPVAQSLRAGGACAPAAPR